jgi:N-succinyldiaminopimelate aminotransferase
MAFCRSLPELCGVVAVPNQVFYADAATGRHLVRFSFAKCTEVLRDAVARLGKLGGAGRAGATEVAL